MQIGNVNYAQTVQNQLNNQNQQNIQNVSIYLFNNIYQ